MTVKLSPIFNGQLVDENGAPAVGWKIKTCLAVSAALQPTFTDSTGLANHTNPIICDALGFPSGGAIWMTAGVAYKLFIYDENDVLKYFVDGVTGTNDSGVTTDEYADTGVTPVYISVSSYSVAGDQTSQFHKGRRQKLTTTAGTVYGRIITAVYDGVSITTVTMQLDGLMVLDSGLSIVQNSILRANVLSLPERIATTTGVVNVYVASVGIVRLVIGDEYKIKFAIANDGALAPTLNLDATGALPIITQSGATPSAGQLNGEHIIRATAAGFIVINPIGSTLRGFIDGLILSTAGASTTMAVSVGQAADSTTSVMMNLLAALSKTTAGWAVGTAAGGKLSAAAIANSTWYYWYLIRRPDTGVVDIGFDVSPTVLTLPANYTQFRYIGAGLTDPSGNWTKFTQTGDEFVWDTPTLDFNSSGSLTATTLTCSIPRGRKMRGLFSAGSSNSTSLLIYLSDLANADLAPSATASPLSSAGIAVAGGAASASQALVWTNTSAQIRHRESSTNGLVIATIGWTDTRGRNS